jgi:hypothetical protein
MKGSSPVIPRIIKVGVKNPHPIRVDFFIQLFPELSLLAVT